MAARPDGEGPVGAIIGYLDRASKRAANPYLAGCGKCVKDLSITVCK